MKRIYQSLILTGLSGVLCLFLSIPANAQRGGGHSGGGSHFSGGGGSFSRGGGSFNGGGGFSGRSNNTYSNRGGFQQQSQASPRLGMQSRGYSMQGNTRAFSDRGSMSGSPRFNNRVGITGNYRGGSVATRGGFYRGGHFYGNTYGNNYGRGYSYSPWRTRAGFYYNRGFYGSLYYPRLGFSLGYLPYGYYPFYWGDSQFFYSNGYFYQHDNDQYTVVEPPIGAAVSSLPDNAQSIVINGQQYYELNGVYYQPITKDDGTIAYQVAGKDGQLDTGSDTNYNDNNVNTDPNGPIVAGPEIGDIFYSLPPDTRKVKLNGQTYLVSPDDFYYQEIRDNNNTKAYQVVGTPGNEPGN